MRADIFYAEIWVGAFESQGFGFVGKGDHATVVVAQHHNGNLVIDRSLEPANGDLAVCCLDGEFTLKRISLADGVVWLIPSNESFVAVEGYAAYCGLCLGLDELFGFGRAVPVLGISVKYDDADNKRPGFKFADYELKGVPVRLVLGARDVEAANAFAKFCPRLCEVPLCRALPSCIMASMV